MGKNIPVHKLYSMMREELSDMDDKEFLSHPSFYELLKGQITSVLNPNENISVECSSVEDNSTGSTDGSVIFVNTWSPLVLECETRYDKYLSNIGCASHECAHVLYTNFKDLNPIRKSFMDGTYRFKYSKDLKKRTQPEKNMFAQSMMDLTNIVEDCYIEACLCSEYPAEGILVRGLEIGNREKFKRSGSLYKHELRVVKGEFPLLTLFVWMIQIKNCLGFEPKDWKKCQKELPFIHEELEHYLNLADPIIKRYCSGLEFQSAAIKELAALVYELLPEIEEQIGNEKGGSSSPQNSSEGQNQSNSKGSKSGKSDSSSKKNSSKNAPKSVSKDVVERAREELNRDSGMSEAANGSGSSKRRPKINGDKVDEAKKVKEKETVDQSKNLEKELAKKIVDGKIQDQQKKDFEELKNEIKNDFTTSDILNTKIVQSKYDGPRDIFAYKQIYRKVEPVARSCKRKILQLLSKREDDELETGFLMGSRFCSSDVYRGDGKYFSRETQPSDMPDVAFSIMIDTSGSMSGDKISKAIEAGILFEDVARGCNIPTHIVSHTAYVGPIITTHVNFRSKEEEKYGLASLKASGGNVDAIVMTLLCEDLQKRNEKSKVLIVISDGAPCGTEKTRFTKSYRGVPYKKPDHYQGYYDIPDQELNACIRYWRKKGIKIIGIALDDVNKIKAIYEEGCLDCRDLSKVPVELVKIFKKYVLK